MALRSTLTPSTPMARETTKVAERSNAGAIDAGPCEEGRGQRVRFHGLIERTGVRIASPSANPQQAGLILMRMGTGAQALVAATTEMSSMHALVDRHSEGREPGAGPVCRNRGLLGPCVGGALPSVHRRATRFLDPDGEADAGQSHAQSLQQADDQILAS
jgi:hypothetical protein